METTTPSLNLAVKGLGNQQPGLKAVVELLGEAIPRRLQGHVVRHGYHSAKRNEHSSLRGGSDGLFSCFPYVTEKRCWCTCNELKELRKMQDYKAQGDSRESIGPTLVP